MLLDTLLWMSIAFTICKAADSANATSSKLIPCNAGWFLHDDKCYKMFGDMRKLTWKQASDKCVAENGNLVTISSFELQAFLVMFLLQSTQKNAWIGLHAQGRQGQFAWEDGSPYNFSYWDKNEPSATGGFRDKEDCVEMRYTDFKKALGTWNDVACHMDRHFICQANKSDTVLSRDPRFCTIDEGEGWKFSNDCYHFVTEAMSWDDAENYCKEIYSGHLVTISDEETFMFVNYITPNEEENFWIGIKMRDHDIQMWSSGLHVNYENFDSVRKPPLPGSCAMMSGRSVWEIESCDRKLPFICEKSNKSAFILKKAPEGWKCPSQSEEWKDLGGEYCYIFETTNIETWSKANQQCVKKGGTLASIHSEAETYVLRHYLKKSRDTVFIGLHRSLSKKIEFEWIDGSLVRYTNWNTGEPNVLKEECVELWTGPMGWNDVQCNNKKGYICSAKKVPPMPNINASVPNECDCRSSNITSREVDRLTSTSTDDICSSGISTKNVTGIVICILLIIFLTGVVVYQYRKQLFCKKLYYSSTHKYSTLPKVKHMTSEIILKPEEYECST